MAFGRRDPQETNVQFATYRPNLHGIWDTDIIEDFTRGETPQQVANELEDKFKGQIGVWNSQPIDLPAWAWESHQLAEDAVYGRLPVAVPIEPPRATPSCADDDHVSTRMLALHEQLDNAYAAQAGATIREQLTKAGSRLADALEFNLAVETAGGNTAFRVGAGMGRGEKDSESWITAAETERSLGFPRDAPFVGWSLSAWERE